MLDTARLLDGYDPSALTIGCFGGRSAIDIAYGARGAGMKSLVLSTQGRERLYSTHFRSRNRNGERVGCVDDVLVLEEFADILQEDIRRKLRERNTLFIQSKYFWRRFSDFNRVESEFDVPIFGSRSLLRLEGRNQPYTTRDLLAEGGIRTPRCFQSPDDINTLAIAKVRDALRGYERVFFLAWDKESFEDEAARRIKIGQITEEEARKAVIEEYVLGAQVNLHFFFSPLTQELELIGIDQRRQTNIEGFQKLTPAQYKLALDHASPQFVEIGHIASTLRESILDRAFTLAEEFIGLTQQLPREIDPTGKGMIGPFTLQGAVVTSGGMEDIVVFGVCFRSTSCPGLAATPYTTYLYGRPVSMGERIAMEIAKAAKDGRLHEIVT